MGMVLLSLIPIVTIGLPDKTKISDEPGQEKSTCSFTVDSDIIKWEARAVKGEQEPALGVGEIVESGGYLKRGDSATIVVDEDELQHGDGLYTISLYVQSTNGYWSDGSFSQVYIGAKYNHFSKYNQRLKYNAKPIETGGIM